MAVYVYHGREGKLYKDTVLVANVSGVTIKVAPNVVEVREHGSRAVAEFKSGDLEITGTIERMWYDFAFLDLIKADALTPFTLELKATREDTGALKTLTVTDAVFTDLSIEWGADDMSTESADFSATSISGT